MEGTGWRQCCNDGSPRRRAPFPIAAYSEFLPPIRFGPLPYGRADYSTLKNDDPWGWYISETEEADELGPGLAKLAHHVIEAMLRLADGSSSQGISRAKLANNPYWPRLLAERSGSLKHERFVILMPLALSRTQDDKGRRRWTVFGGSEQGPSRAFWRSFQDSLGHQVPEGAGVRFITRLLDEVYGDSAETAADLLALGFRILPRDDEGDLPGWSRHLLWKGDDERRSIRHLLTFRPFSLLPESVQHSYLEGRLNLIPFPGSLLFWGVESYRRLELTLPLASQIPLLQLVSRHEGPHGLRVPQSGWLHEPHPERSFPVDHHGPLRPTFQRTHRNARVHRDVDELADAARQDHMSRVLFSTAPEDVGLYGKPMARNVQLWTHDERVLLDGPRATTTELREAETALKQGGLFGYRFLYPAMRLGSREVYWHRPLAAFRDSSSAVSRMIPDAPLGYLTAYDATAPQRSEAVELWPRLLRREEYALAQQALESRPLAPPSRTLVNVRMVLDVGEELGDTRLSRDFARHLVNLSHSASLESWLERLPTHANDPSQGRKLVEFLEHRLDLSVDNETRLEETPTLTFGRTAQRRFEVEYWKTIATLSDGRYLNKNNADCVLDVATQKSLRHHDRDLDPLCEYLLARHQKAIALAGLQGKAFAGSFPFSWQTDFAFPWMGGWLRNQERGAQERNLIVVIPGRDHRRAIVMADHYDTAFRGDRYDRREGGDGARIAAPGADDNGSATAALLLAAPVFLELSAAGKLACDIWLVHLTGEEFPADCMGARHLCQALVEGSLRVTSPQGDHHDLSSTKVDGVYLLDMVAHNNDHDRDRFQISPGRGRESLWLAYQGHLAALLWNRTARLRNRGGSRRGRPRGVRSGDSSRVPAIAPHLPLSGDVRLPDDPRSTLYNTDGQIFSDAGVPVVLFMENYDINRTGYHDSADTMSNIDLDYGSALAAIAIEAVARAATHPYGLFL